MIPKNTKAFILAAGLGTRLKPFTDNHPKALALVNGQSLLQRNIENLISLGINDIVINVHHFADQIVKFIDEKKFDANILISDETNEVLETGGGLLFAKKYLYDADHILIWNVDILGKLNLKEAFEKHIKNEAMATLMVSDRHSSRKLLWKNDMLVGWKNLSPLAYRWVLTEQLNYIEKAFSGIHIVSSEIFDNFVHTGKFSIIETYFDLAKHFLIQDYDHSGQLVIDVGKPESIMEAEKYFH